jgi:hypothetical protein
MHVDAIGKHGEGFGFKFQFSLTFLGGPGPKVRARFQPFGQKPRPRSIPVKHFEQAAPFVAEHKERSAARVLLQPVCDQGMQRVGPGAHVTGIQGDVDLEAAAKAQHGWARDLSN